MNINPDKLNFPLVIASTNQGKVQEFRDLLSELSLNIFSQPADLKVEETGTTFIENARIKALTVSKLTNEWSLADDSGLSVEALNGEPGIHSSRYANTDSERISKLLKELEPFDNRNATFTAALCLAVKGKVLIEVEGKCQGLITKKPRGDKGFGYDPVFEVIGLGMTFAEMGKNKKKVVGHRGQAFQLLLPRLQEMLSSKNLID